MNKRREGVFHIPFGKRGQFFILSAVIISVIIVSMISVKNSVSVGETPRKFYYYSEQLKDETGAIVDWALYNGEDATNIENFVQQGIAKTAAGYPTMEIVSCWTKPGALNQGWLTCQNNGKRSVVVNTSEDTKSLSGSIQVIYDRRGNPRPNSDDLNILNQNFLTIAIDGNQPCNIPIQNSSIQTGQFYFVFRVNTTAGDYTTNSQIATPLNSGHGMNSLPSPSLL